MTSILSLVNNNNNNCSVNRENSCGDDGCEELNLEHRNDSELLLKKKSTRRGL